MGFLSTVVGGLLGSVIPGIMANESADKQADSIVNATKLANQTQMDMFNRSIALNEPYRVAGLNALAQQGGLLGMPGMVSGDVVNQSLMAGPAGASVWEQYGQQNPAVLQYFQNNPGALAKFGGDMNKALEYHYNTYGKSQGFNLPTVAGGASGGASGGGSGGGFTGATADPYQTFLDSGFGKSMLETTNADFDNMVGAFGAGGNALSGSAIGALNDRNRRNTSSAFNNYYNALSGISDTGANIGSQQGQQAIQTGQNIAAGQQSIGNTRASSYAMQGANGMGMYNNALSGLGYGAGKSGGSWFGG